MILCWWNIKTCFNLCCWMLNGWWWNPNGKRCIYRLAIQREKLEWKVRWVLPSSFFVELLVWKFHASVSQSVRSVKKWKLNIKHYPLLFFKISYKLMFLFVLNLGNWRFKGDKCYVKASWMKIWRVDTKPRTGKNSGVN